VFVRPFCYDERVKEAGGGSILQRAIPRLCVASSPRAAWDSAARPWFQQHAHGSWARDLLTVVVVPTRNHANELKSRLLADDVPYLGLHFVTPAGLRDLLFCEDAARRASWPQLRVLLSISAEEIAQARTHDASIARAVMRAPDTLLRTLDRVETAGWDFNDLALPSFAGVVARFRQHLHACGLQMPARLDRDGAMHVAEQAPKIAALLVTGFDGAHWADWPLLHAAAETAIEATIVLPDARDEARELDETWIGTWEEQYGEAAQLTSTEPRAETLFPDLFEPELHTGTPAVPASQTHFLVGRTVSEQAKAVVALTEAFLGSAAAERIGILFAGPGALARSVAALLAEAGIPHHDGIAHLAPGPFEEEAWFAWLELQENPRLRILLRFLRSSPAAAALFNGLRVEQIEDVLRRSHRDLLIDDLALLRAYCAGLSFRSGADAVAQGLAAIRFLPEQTTFSGFLNATREIFAVFCWRDRLSCVEQAAVGWCEHLDTQFARTTFLRWLGEVTASVLPVRSPEGDHPYSRVQLLHYAHADGQQWSHLIFTGLNEGSWPRRADETGLLDDREIAELNGRIKKLNRRAVRQGRQGEGHSIVAAGKTFCLGPAEHRATAERQLQNLRESATVAIGATANLVEETAPERFANPSEFFTRLYFEARGEAPGEATMAALEQQTSTWLARHAQLPAKSSEPDVAQTAIAYRARNTPEVQFGEYEFALREPLPRDITLSATDWEQVIKAPALVWLKKFLGVEAAEDEFTNWNMAIGQWVHAWLSHIAKSDGAFVERPQAEDVRSRVRNAALRFRVDVQGLLGRALPDWWISAWNQAAFIADTLAETITTTDGWSHFATEWTLPPSRIRVSDAAEFAVRGRVDLLIAKRATEAGTFPFEDVWIIDYKTGRRASLAPGRKVVGEKAVEDFRTKLLDGKGVQLAIYALALHALGAREVGVSLLTRELELDRPQVSFPAIEAQRAIWEEFARISRSGVFGMRGSLRGEFRFQKDYPLATLGFDADFLEEKWNATHPALPKIERA
jgi:hypothetical protein